MGMAMDLGEEIVDEIDVDASVGIDHGRAFAAHGIGGNGATYTVLRVLPPGMTRSARVYNAAEAAKALWPACCAGPVVGGDFISSMPCGSCVRSARFAVLSGGDSEPAAMHLAVLAQPFGGAFVDDAAMPHHQHAVTDFQRDRQPLFDQQHRDTVPADIQITSTTRSTIRGASPSVGSSIRITRDCPAATGRSSAFAARRRTAFPPWCAGVP